MADMPDASAYGLRPIAPNPEMMQVAPNVSGSVVPLLPAPPQVPNVSDYNIPPQAVQPQTVAPMPQRSKIPTLADIVASAEQKSGKPLTPAEFEDANQWYKTNILTPQLWNVKGANKNKVAAEVAAYDDAVKREADKRFPKQNPADQKSDTSWLGSLLSSGVGQITKSASAGAGMLAGGIASAYGLAPNTTADKFFAMANPDIQSTAQIDTKSLVEQRQKLLDFYANNPQAQERIKTQLDPQILAQMALAAAPNNGVEYGNAQIAAAQKANPSAAFLGQLGGQILPYFLSPGVGAALSTTGNISSNAAQQLSEGQNLDKVLSQALVDAPLESVASLVPLGFGGSLTKRALQGAAVNTGLNLTQQGADATVNNNNKISGASVGTSAALGGLLALIFGGKANANIRDAIKEMYTKDLPPSPLTKFVGNVLKGKKSGPALASVQPSNATTEAPNTPKNVVDAVEADMTPKQAYTDLRNNNVTTEGLPDNEFNRLNNNIQKQAELMAKKFKPPSSFDTPEDLVDASIKYAKALTKNKFYEMTPDQREELVGNLASWFGKRAKIDNNDISNAILGMRTVSAAENAAATPPPEANAQTQSEQTVQATQAPIQQTQTAQTPTQQTQYTPVSKYDPIWQAATDTNTPVSQLPQEMQGLATQVRNRRIPNRQAFDNVLQTAEAKAGNKLQNQPKQNADTTSLHPPETQNTQTEAPDTRKVSDVLSSRSTKTSEVSLRRQLRAMLKTSGAKDDELNKLKNLSVKSLQEKAKATKTKRVLAKTNIEPIENPDEITPTSKNKLKTRQRTKESTPPKSEAPIKENVGAKNKTPLETLLQERLGGRLPKTSLDEIHDAIESAQAGDRNDLTDLITGLRNSGDIDGVEAKWLRNLPKQNVAHDLVDESKQVVNNASGESSASLEAQGRVSDERAAGRTRAVIRRDGTVVPLVGVDAVDIHARPGEVVAQRGLGRDPTEWTILSHGDDMSRDAAMGKVNKAKQALDDTHEEMQSGRNQEDESIPEHSISPEEFESLHFNRGKLQNSAQEHVERIAPLNVKREVDNIVQTIREGSDVKEAGRRLTELSDKLAAKNLRRNLNQMSERRRGPEWVKARLQRLIADSDPGSNHYAAAKMALWLVDKNPKIADGLGITINSRMENAGFFSPLTKMLGLNADDLNKTTGLHELLHASEGLLPENIQNNIRGEYIGRIQNKLKKTTNEWARTYLKNAIRNFVTPNESDQLAMIDILKNHRDEVPANEYYKYFNPSEYWAEEGSNIFARRYDANGWIGQAKQWLSEFGEHIKNLFGLDNNSQVIKGLSKMLKATDGENGMLNKSSRDANSIKENETKDYDPEQVGDDPTDQELGYETDKASDVDPNMQKEVTYDKKAKDLGNYNDTDKIIESLALSEHGLEKAVQFGYRENIPIDENNNVFDAVYEKRNITRNTQDNDRFEVVNPADDWVHNNYSKFANSTKEAYDLINDFYGAKNMLERAETAWWLESPLDGTAEIDRGMVFEKLNDGDITPDKARAQLRRLAKDHSILDWQQYAESKGTDIESLEKILSDLKSKGVDENSLAEHNKLTQAIRDRLENNLIKSGDVAKADPYVKLYDWKWYVPLKGSPFGGKVDGNFDLIPDRNIALSRLNKQIALMKGRNSLADKPYFRLMVDLARSADRIGHKAVMDKLYNLLTTEGTDGVLALKKYGAKIDVFHGFQKKGYTSANGKQIDRLKAPANGVIINDGDTHYVVTLPHNSELLRGLIQMDNIKAPKNKYNRTAGRVTNALARLYTTINPRWVVSVGFARDITYVPLTMAATRFDNPLQAIPFIARYVPEILGAYKALPTIIPQIVGNDAALRAAAAADPQSWAAKTLRYKAAGGANYFTRSFDISGVEKELLSRYEDTNGVIDATKYGVKKIMDYTGNFANSLELLTRVAMFNQLVKEGMSDATAGIQVRKIMDYEQSGVNGRLINSWLAFFRVGATGTDVIRRAFTKKTGGLDYAKFAKWQLFMGSLGYLSYMAAMQLLGKDDDGKYKIQKINPSQLTSKAFFPVGDKIGSLNLGLGIPQFMLAPGILAAALEQGHIDRHTALKSYMDMLERNGPTSPGGALGDNPTDYAASAFFGFMPTAVRPILDTSRNTNSFSSPIHTSDPDRNKFASDQGYPNTAAAYKDIATWIREHSGDTIDLFPEDIKYWINSYGGSPASDFTKWAFESGDVKAGGEPPMGRLAGSFFVDTSHYMSRDLFDALDTLAESSKRYNHLVSTAMHSDGLSRDQAKAKVSEVTNRDSSFAARLEAYKELLKAHKDYNAQVNSLRDNKLLSDTRKQLIRKQADSQLRKAIEKAQSVIDKTSS